MRTCGNNLVEIDKVMGCARRWVFVGWVAAAGSYFENFYLARRLWFRNGS